MSLLSWIGVSSGQTHEIDEIFPFKVAQDFFVKADIVNLYSRILTDVFERTQGLTEEQKALLWDSCLGSENQDGLVTMLAKAMTDKGELFLVYKPALKVIRKATGPETEQIKADYKKEGKSAVGVFITFKNLDRSDMIKIYSALEYNSVAALTKAMNLSKAIQIKLTGLRGDVALKDADVAKEQAVKMAKGLGAGKDIMMDEKDKVETTTVDLTPTKAAIEFIDQKRSLYSGMPASYINGSQNTGLGDSGNADAKAVERGLKGYFFAVVKPICDAIFEKPVTFESEDYAQISQALETLKTFELTSDEHLSKDNKTKIINRMFGLPEDTTGDEPPKAPPIDVTPPPKEIPAPGQAPPTKS